MAEKSESCELCQPAMVLFGDEQAYVRFDSNSLSQGRVLVTPRRHVTSDFDTNDAEKASVQALPDRAQAQIAQQFSPDGYNIGVNVGKAAGQSRMHVHLHLIPRYDGDVTDPRCGIRCVLPKRGDAG